MEKNFHNKQNTKQRGRGKLKKKNNQRKGENEKEKTKQKTELPSVKIFQMEPLKKDK